MPGEAPLIPWLEHLRQLYPPRGVVVVGAGNGTGPWIQALRRWNTKHVILVEADDGQFQHLQRSTADHEGWLLRRQIVAHASRSVTFHLASNPAENGLLKPEHLRALWPNLETRQEEILDALTLAELLRGVTPQPSWLWLDCLPAASLLQGAGDTLDGIDVIMLRGTPPGIDIPAEHDAASSIAAATRQLRLEGFLCVATESSRNPGIAHALYVRDYTAQSALAGEQARQAQARADRAEAQLAKTSAELIRHAEEQPQILGALQQIQTTLKELETSQRNEMRKGLANVVKQVEAFISIQDYLRSGDLLVDFHGWHVSPDIGFFLLEKIRERRYDLIIEFGSGTSTALFAKGVEATSRAALAAAGETVTEIVSFEHDALYHHKTRQLLQARDLANGVRLIHAPLIDWSEGEQHYLFYDCQTTLSALGEKYAPRQVRILLLVDGPPGSTCANARYPAVPLVFNVLGKHQIDVVLDDANRHDEKAVIELWRTFWTKRSVRTSDSSIPSEKGIYLAQAQPSSDGT